MLGNTGGLTQKVVKDDFIESVFFFHSDNRSPMKASTFQTLLEKLGIQSSFSRPRVSNDNPYSEAMFRTMKYRPEFPYKGFENLSVAREWTRTFVHWYTCEHQHSGHKFVTPEEVHSGEYINVLKNREIVYEQAKQKFLLVSLLQFWK